MVTLNQYQKFCKIPSGSTSIEQNKSLADLIGLNTSKLTNNEIETKIKEWLGKIVTSKKEHTYIRIGKKWYKVDRDLYSLTFDQWIYFDKIMKGIDDKNVNDITHFLIATFLRECRIYKFFPKAFNVNKIEKIAKLVQDKLDISIGLELINFFFLYIINSMNNSQIDYLEKLERMCWEKVKD